MLRQLGLDPFGHLFLHNLLGVMAGIDQRDAGHQRILRRMVVDIARDQHIGAAEDRAAKEFFRPIRQARRLCGQAGPSPPPRAPCLRSNRFYGFHELPQSCRLLLANPAQSEAAAFEIHGIEVIGDFLVRMGL